MKHILYFTLILSVFACTSIPESTDIQDNTETSAKETDTVSSAEDKLETQINPEITESFFPFVAVVPPFGMLYQFCIFALYQLKKMLYQTEMYICTDGKGSLHKGL